MNALEEEKRAGTLRLTQTDTGEGDTTEPYPLDMGGSPGAPAAYKGLLLQITDKGFPLVTTVDGVIGVICIGMSNSSIECSDFIKKLNLGVFDSEFNPQIKVVNCAVGGRAIERWNDPAYDELLWDACLE